MWRLAAPARPLGGWSSLDLGDNGLWYPGWSPAGPPFHPADRGVYDEIISGQLSGVSPEEISDNLGQDILSQNVCTTVCMCPYMFAGRVSIISIICSNGSPKFIHLKDFLPKTNQAWDSVLGLAVHTESRWTQHVWLGRDWGLGWEMAQSAF